MSEGARSGANTDPTELWRQWYDATFGAWADLMGNNEAAPGTAPYDFYQRWLDILRDAQGEEKGGDAGLADSYQAWRQWTEATTETWRRAAETWTRMAQIAAPRWAEMTQEFQKQMLDGGLPADPMDFYTRWYKATSGPMSELADDVLRDEAFLENSRRLFEYYAIFDSVFGRAAEEYFGNLRLPTSSDTDRIAGLVVALDDKLDRTEETLEGELEQRLERVESRLDQLDRLESKLDQLLEAQNSTSGE